MNIQLLERGLFVGDLAWQLKAHPELWNQHRMRTENPDSPHHGLDDIWCRYAADWKETGPHESVWYPSAAVIGKPLFDLVNWVMFRVGGKVLGGVLITRIPPGAACRPHADLGWHAREYEKIAVQVESAPGQKFCFDGEELETRQGDMFWFDNAKVHWVPNDSAYERVTLIVCLKR